MITIAEKKKRMKAYVDFFGCRLINYAEIDQCKTNEELIQIFSTHHSFLEDQCNDAQKSMERFQRSIGVYSLE